MSMQQLRDHWRQIASCLYSTAEAYWTAHPPRGLPAGPPASRCVRGRTAQSVGQPFAGDLRSHYVDSIPQQWRNLVRILQSSLPYPGIRHVGDRLQLFCFYPDKFARTPG